MMPDGLHPDVHPRQRVTLRCVACGRSIVRYPEWLQKDCKDRHHRCHPVKVSFSRLLAHPTEGR